MRGFIGDLTVFILFQYLRLLGFFGSLEACRWLELSALCESFSRTALQECGYKIVEFVLEVLGIRSIRLLTTP